MDQVRLGSTGLHVSRVCLGMMSYGNDSRPAVGARRGRGRADRAARGRGRHHLLRHRRHVLAAARARWSPAGCCRSTSRATRSSIATKVLHADDARARTAAGCRASTSCRRSTRRSSGSAWTTSTSTRSTAGTRDTPIEETMEALHDVVRAGKARYIGASSMYAWQFAKAQHVAERNGWTRFVSMQNHYNLLYREEEREMIPLCLDQGVGVIPWSPLARGLLAGNRTRAGEKRTTRAGDRRVRRLRSTAARRLRRRRPRRRGRGRARRAAGAGRAGVAAAPARRDRADRRRDEARPPRGRARRGGARR